MAATNGLGWVVEQYIHEHGWAAVTQPYLTPQEAEAVREAQFPAGLGFRVYEVLDHPTTKRNT